jgi:hypothetical protein
MNCVIVGARERKEVDQDKDTITELLRALVSQHSKTRLNVVSAGCDRGIGKLVRDLCMQNKIIFAEVRIKFEGEEIPRHFFIQSFLARNRALHDLGDEFYVFRGPNPNGIVEALIEPAKGKVGESRVHTYDELETNP